MSSEPEAVRTTVCFSVQDTLAIEFSVGKVPKEGSSDTLCPSLLEAGK